jgi:hypothetical protein
MTREDIVELVGRNRYEAECAMARSDASRADYGRGAGASLTIPHEIEEALWDGPAAWSEKLSQFFEIYDEMPSYAHLMYVQQRFGDFDPEARRVWWSEVRARLNCADSALREPLLYSLWCDFFEDDVLVTEAWAALTGPDATEKSLRAILPISGPVPFDLKQEIYRRLIDDAAWHLPIFESLLGSAFDVSGKIDQDSARLILRELRLPSDLAGLDRLRAQLA